MTKNTIHTWSVCVVATGMLLAAHTAYASEIRYQPINPAFGGNPFNNSYLMGTAEVQKAYNAPVVKREVTDPLDDFANTLSRSLVSRLSRDITDAILGEDAQDSGQFVVDDMVLNFERINDVVNIEILDSTGNSTQIELPAPLY